MRRFFQNCPHCGGKLVIEQLSPDVVRILKEEDVPKEE